MVLEVLVVDAVVVDGSVVVGLFPSSQMTESSHLEKLETLGKAWVLV